MVDRFFSPARNRSFEWCTGKRAASSLFALSETLKRRALHMGEKTEADEELDLLKFQANDVRV